MARELRQYPAPPPNGTDPRTDSRFYHVVQDGEIVAVYDSAHYRSPAAVLRDLGARGARGEVVGN